MFLRRNGVSPFGASPHSRFPSLRWGAALLATPLEQFEMVVAFAAPSALLPALSNVWGVVAYLGAAYLLVGAATFATPRLVRGGWLQTFGEVAVRSLGEFLVANGGRAQQGHLPLLLLLALLLTSYNVGGLIPYGFTLSAHLVCTFLYGFAIFFGLNYVALVRYGRRFFGIFLPSGIAVGLMPLLVPIEVVSYFFKPISLSVRLFANMLAGHALLKILLTFAFGGMGGGILPLLLSGVGLSLVGAILLLEFLVALLQVFVFLTLVCLYISEVHTVEH
jgi:F-type H+-transporting ATPase subunit a